MHKKTGFEKRRKPDIICKISDKYLDINAKYLLITNTCKIAWNLYKNIILQGMGSNPEGISILTSDFLLVNMPEKKNWNGSQRNSIQPPLKDLLSLRCNTDF